MTGRLTDALRLADRTLVRKKILQPDVKGERVCSGGAACFKDLGSLLEKPQTMERPALSSISLVKEPLVALN